MPGSLDPLRAGIEISIDPTCLVRIAHAAAALSWLSAAAVPQRSTAAIQRPRTESSGLPTE